MGEMRMVVLARLHLPSSSFILSLLASWCCLCAHGCRQVCTCHPRVWRLPGHARVQLPCGHTIFLYPCLLVTQHLSPPLLVLQISESLSKPPPLTSACPQLLPVLVMTWPAAPQSPLRAPWTIPPAPSELLYQALDALLPWVPDLYISPAAQPQSQALSFLFPEGCPDTQAFSSTPSLPLHSLIIALLLAGKSLG